MSMKRSYKTRGLRKKLLKDMPKKNGFFFFFHYSTVKGRFIYLYLHGY